MRHSSIDLLGYAVLTLTLQLNERVEGACKDFQGRTFDTGYYYVPGPEPCTLCVCDHGNPKWCKAVICQLPEKQGCKSFRFGTACCEIICLDDTLSSVTNDKNDGIGGNNGDGAANYDLGLRLVASCITAVLSLSLLFFLIHRLRQRKIRVCVAGRQNRQLTDDQRSLGSMGYLERGGLPHGVQLDDLACGGGYPLWKPPGNYFPRGEAPPPYEEAVAAARAEQALLTMSPHALSPLNLPNSYLSAHNSHASVGLVAGGAQTGLPVGSPTPSGHNVSGASPSISSAVRPLNASSPHANNFHQSSQNDAISGGLYPGTTTTSFTMGVSTYENLPVPPSINMTMTPQHSCVGHQQPQHQQQQQQQHQQQPQHQQQQQQHLVNNPLPLSIGQSKNYQHHTTLPRQTSAFTISATLPSSSVSAHRTIPRTLATSGNLRLRRDFNAHQMVAPLFGAQLRNLSPERLPRSAPPTLPVSQNVVRSDAVYEDVHHGPPSAPPQLEGKPIEVPATSNEHFDVKAPLLASGEANQDGSFESVTCTCSMQALPTLHDDADDYRSECENCKSATGSRYYLDNEDELVTSPHETMTLHRRPEETAASVTPQYYRTSLTLPTSTRQRTRSTGARGNWFSSMPESSTESSDED